MTGFNWPVNPATGDATKEMTNTTAFLSAMMVMTIDDAVNGHVTMEPVSETYADVCCWLKYSGSLAWDHDKDVLYLACAYENANDGDWGNMLWQVDPETGVGTLAHSSGMEDASQLQVCMNGLMVIPDSIGPDPYEPTGQVGKVDISLESLSILKGTEMTLDATALPWNLTNRDLIWSSSDDHVVTVENGRVVAVSPGEAVITAAAAQDPTKKDPCAITVEAIPNIALTASVYDADSHVAWSEFTADAPEKWTAASETMPNFIAGGFYNKTVYAHDGSNIYAVDPMDFTTTNLGSLSSNWLWSDAAPAPKTANGAMGRLVGLGGSYLELYDPEAGSLQYMDIGSKFDAPMATIAYVGSGTYYGMPSNTYYLMTQSGTLYDLYLFSDSPDGCYVDYAAWT